MTNAQVPKGTPSPLVTSLPNISWFELILNEKLLKEHLNSENPDPSPCQLIVQFLHQAELEMNAVIQAAAEKINKPQGPPGAVPMPVNKVEEEPKPIKPTKKVKALRLLALKIRECYVYVSCVSSVRRDGRTGTKCFFISPTPWLSFFACLCG